MKQRTGRWLIKGGKRMLVSDYKESTYSYKVLGRLEELIPHAPKETIRVNFETGITKSGLEALAEAFEGLVKKFPRTNGVKTVNVYEIIDPRSDSDLPCYQKKYHRTIGDYQIFTYLSGHGKPSNRDYSLFVRLWNTTNELAYPLEDEAYKDTEETKVEGGNAE